MESEHHKPDTEHVLRSLKDFQRRTVDYVFRRMYLDPVPTRRFLVADEVGLGKTLVARGLIAKVVEELWESVERIDVVYICSNADIARQNIARLHIADKNDFTPPARLTLLPLHVRGLKDGRRLNFVAFTPGTSFDLKSSAGTGPERALLYRILCKPWGLGGRRAPFNVLSAWMNTANFEWYCSDMAEKEIEEGIEAAFLKRLGEHEAGCSKKSAPSLRATFERLCGVFSRSDSSGTAQDRVDRDELIGELRKLMAFTCLDWLQPDLVIMDEFQRFKHLLDDRTEAGELAKGLIDYSDKHSAARVVLLSATPYKMYSLHGDEDGDNHYGDFVGTLKFLLNDEGRTRRVKELFDRFSRELHKLPGAGNETLLGIKNEAEAILRSVMVRTERLSTSQDRNGMLREMPCADMAPTADDISHYLSHARVGRHLDTGSIIDYWKSAPYLFSFMDEYQVMRRFKERVGAKTDDAIRQELLRDPGLTLPHHAVKNYQAVSSRNARLRALMRDVIDSGAWKLLWVPPSLPYHALAGPFAQPGMASFTKRLVFSCWQVVPKVIAALVSYEAERRCILSREKTAKNTKAARKRRPPLLRFGRSDDRLTGLPVLAMVYPSVAMACATDPLRHAHALAGEDGVPPPFEEVFWAAREEVVELVSQLNVPVNGDEGQDADWYWAAPFLLDMASDPVGTLAWLEQDDLPEQWSAGDVGEEADQRTRWQEHVDRARKLVKDFASGSLAMGRRPDDLADTLTWMGIAGSGCCALRAFQRYGFKKADCILRNAGARVGYAFLTQFNLPESMALIRGLDGGDESGDPYWRQVLKYSGHGCLQAVLDEYAHILRESAGHIDAPAEKTIPDVAKIMVSVLRLRTSRVGVEYYIAKPKRPVRCVEATMRVRYAMRFGKQDSDDGGEPTREDQVRSAFNSPFWPFVLSTTSIGQEGLDFHQYCHAVVHWNLPGNPVDLEQREGRVHRYKGHAIRKNSARRHGVSAGLVEDPWPRVFRLARLEAPPGASEIEPFWVCPLHADAAIQRHVPVHPTSRDELWFADLKRAVSLYRLAFGQLRQEDLVTFLGERLDSAQITAFSKQLVMNLEPTESAGHE